MIYQFKYSERGDTLEIIAGKNITYQPHLHNSFEFVAVNDGKMTITVEKKSYALQKGDALLIFPNQVHEFKTMEYSTNFICIFSPELVSSYARLCENKAPVSNLLHTDRNYQKELVESAPKNIISTQGVLYSLCGEFHENAKYADRAAKSTALIAQIFKFVERNYHKDCTLKALSKETAYNYVYLSRYFKEATGVSFIEYVNSYRVNKACCELKSTNKTVLQTAYDSGFDSLRNFNRVFKKITGVTPGEYRI